jgi:hypothetical protein
MPSLAKGLGEDVRKVEGTGDLAKDQVTTLQLLSNEEVANLNVLRASMEHRLLGQMNSARIVTIQGSSRHRMPKLSEKEWKPASFLGSKSGRIELSFTGREGSAGGAGRAPADSTGAQREEVAIGGTTIRLAVRIGRVTESEKIGLGDTTKGEAEVTSAAQIAEDTASSCPMNGVEAARPNEARQNTNRIGEVWTSAHHGVHEGPNELRVGDRRRARRGRRSQLVIELDGGGNGVGMSHVKTLQNWVDVEGLGEGDGASSPITDHLHAKVVAKLPKILAEEALLEGLLDVTQRRGIFSNEDHVINVNKNEHVRGSSTNIEARIRGCGREAQSLQMGGELAVPLKRSLLEAIDRATQVPDSARRKNVRKARRPLHEYAFTQVPLEEGVGYVHSMSLPITSSRKVEKTANGGQLGGGGECVEEINTMLLSEALSTVARFEHWKFARQLLHTKHPFPFYHIDIRRRYGINERFVASECSTLGKDSLKPLFRVRARHCLRVGVWNRNKRVLARESKGRESFHCVEVFQGVL